MSGRLCVLLLYTLIVYHNLQVTLAAVSSRSGGGGRFSSGNARLETLEAEVEELTKQVNDLAEKVEVIAIDRWCEKTIGCYFELTTGTLTFSDIPGHQVVYTGIPNELRSKVTTLNIIALTLDTDFFVSNLDGLENLSTITLTSISWVGNFTSNRACLPKLKKFSITSSKFIHDLSYLEDTKLKNVLFFDKTNGTSSTSTGETEWSLDEVHKLGVDINVHGQFILEHATGVLTSYRRPIETLLNNIESNNADFVLKYLYLSSYNLTATTKLPATIEFLGLNAVQFLGSRTINLVVTELKNLQVLDIIAFLAYPMKLDLNSFSGSNSINTLRLSGSVELSLSNPKLQFKTVETLRWFNVKISTSILSSFATIFPNLQNIFLVTEDKDIQYPFLQAILKTNVKNVMLPEFNYDVGSDRFNGLKGFFEGAGLDTNEGFLGITKMDDGSWEKGSKFNFWKD